MIAAAFLLAAQVAAAVAQPPYDALVAQAVAAARAGERGTAEGLLAQARALDPARPEAAVELAGLRFLDGRYHEAVDLLRPALGRADAHAHDLLATSLHLAGRPDEAVDAWNALRRPVLRNVRVNGMHDTRARLVVPQLAFVEGAVLTRDQLRETRLRLAETGAFQRAAVRPVPLGTGEADVEVALVERRGLGTASELAALTLSKALQRTAYLRYDNFDGTGIGARAAYRWEDSQPRAELAVSWPRPLGLGATLLAGGEWERAAYDLDGDRLTLAARGAEIAMRRVLGARTVGEVRWRGRRRSFREGPGVEVSAARPGRVSGLSVQLERRVADGGRVGIEAAASAFAAAPPLGSELRFAVARARVRMTVAVGGGDAPEASVLAAQLVAGSSTAETPLDELFVPGAASEMELPLRPYRDRTDGVLGATPIGRDLLLVNLEWRRRLARWGPAALAGVLFYDAAAVGRTVSEEGHSFLHGLGAGLRLDLLGVLIRADYAVAIGSPSGRAFTAGLGQVF